MTTPRFAATTRVRPAAEVLATDLAGETVILDLKAGVYFGLDQVGTTIWELIERGQTVRTIVDAVVEQYDIAADTADADLQALLHELVERRLVVAEDGPNARA